MRRNLQGTRGQVLLEYILMLLVLVVAVVALAATFKTSIHGLWIQMTQQVSAACPTCKSPNPGLTVPTK